MGASGHHVLVIGSKGNPIIIGPFRSYKSAEKFAQRAEKLGIKEHVIRGRTVHDVKLVSFKEALRRLRADRDARSLRRE